MSANEIKALAQQAFVDGMASHHAGLLKTEERCKQYANALLAYAEMVERCERLLGCTFYLEDGHTNIDHIIKHQLNYILRGDAEKEEK